ncbi:(Na+)-NQR maturation NqrM [Vibrio sp. JPW-9-11-11]|uniref:(Na+)-NQR maturation NqrM n=1 Tax=Vibrio sp. JPW-9-11-11 TaxID=1416532 RepID=UPI0015940EF6|nr:(Na+)-NQR maturation NqrM [Vibrio sp. JPW-9-11-11]NVD08476.1 (Na+)-NQR maturation NqrM [Vibrio sp. JPW-9-11-11]
MTYILCFLVFLGVIVLMAVGVILQRKTLQGSCGGLATLKIERECNCVSTCDEHSYRLYQIQEPKDRTMIRD